MAVDEKEKQPVNMAVPLLPTEYVLHGDKYCYWLTKTRPKQNNPFEIVETDSLGYFDTIGDCLATIPKKTLARPDITELKELIAAVKQVEQTVKDVAAQINERFGEINGN